MRRTLIPALALATGAGAVLLGAGVLLPRLAEQQVRRALAEAESTYGVDIEVAGLSASWARFPRAAVAVDGLVATGRAPFEGQEILALPEVEVAVDLRHLLGERLVIQHLRVDGGALTLRRTAEGSNWAQGDRSGDPSSWTFELDHVDAVGLRVDHLDTTKDLAFAVEGLAFEGNGVLDGQALDFTAESHADALTFGPTDAPWLVALPLDAALPFVYDKPTGAVAFGAVSGTLGTVPLELTGDLAPRSDGWHVALAVDAPDATVGQVLAVLPGVRHDAVTLASEGEVDLSVRVDGALTETAWPGGTARLAVEGGRLTARDGGPELRDLTLQLEATREQGPLEATRLVLEQARFDLDGEPFALGGEAAPPLTDPAIDAWARGAVDLARLAQVVPLEQPLSGRLDVDARVATQGREVRAGEGRAEGTGIVWGEGEDRLAVDRLVARFDGRDLHLDDLRLQSGETALAARGVLGDALAWYLGDGVLSGELVLDAERIDLRSSGDGATGVLEVPADLDLAVRGSAAELVTDELSLYGAEAVVRLERGVARVERASGEALGGRIGLSGTYTTNQGAPFGLTGRATLEGLRLSELMAQVNLLQRIAPIAERAGGRVSGDLTVDTSVAADGTVVVEALTGDGTVRLAQGSSLTPPVLEEAARRLGLARLAQLDLDGARMDFTIREGQLRLEPVDVALGPFDTTLSGGVGIVDRTLDLAFDLEVPTARLAQAQGLTLPPAARQVDLVLAVTGPYDAPELGIRAGDATQDLIDGAVDEATDRVREELSALVAEAARQGDRLIAEAQGAADAVKAEAAKAAKALRQEARQQSKRLVDQAQGPVAKAAAQAAADVAVQQANRAARTLEREAAQEADRLVRAAEDEKDRLVAEARRAGRQL